MQSGKFNFNSQLLSSLMNVYNFAFILVLYDRISMQKVEIV